MDNVEYVVPPAGQGPAQKSTGILGGSGNAPKPPKKPSKITEWVRSHKFLSAGTLVMAGIIVLVGSLMITKQKVSLFGLELNPFYNQAACPINSDPNSCNPPDDEENPPITTPITITGELAPGTVGVLTSQPLALSGTPNVPCDWQVRSTTLPPFANATMVTQPGDRITANFEATPGAAGTYSVRIQVTCQNAQIADRIFSFVVNEAPTSTISIEGTLAPGTVGVRTSQPFTLSGTPTTPCDWSVRANTLPPFANATMNPAVGVTSNFEATPGLAGSYPIRIQVVCANNQSATKDFNWVVNAAPTQQPLSITGTFPNGRVNQAYTTDITTVNAGTSSCTFTLVSVTPNIPGAALNRVDNVAIGTETSAVFSATPQTARTYVVSTSVSCPPIAGDDTGGPTRVATKEFNWTVTGSGGGGSGGSGGGSGSATSCTTPANLNKLVAIYRYWNGPDGDHFYTTNANEIPANYVAEGIAGYVYNTQVTGTVAIYRSYSVVNRAHYYSTTDDAPNYGYAREGIIGYAFPSSVSGALPWFRMHKGYPVSDYLETTSTQEQSQALALGYVNEGVVANICTSR